MVGGRLEKRYSRPRVSRVVIDPLVTFALRRRNDNDDAAAGPSLLSHKYIQPPGERLLSPNITVAADATTVAANDNNFSLLTTSVYQVFQQCSGWHPKYSNKPHPLISMLGWGKKKQPRGWARWHDAHLRDNGTKRYVSGRRNKFYHQT